MVEGSNVLYTTFQLIQDIPGQNHRIRIVFQKINSGIPFRNVNHLTNFINNSLAWMIEISFMRSEQCGLGCFGQVGYSSTASNNLLKKTFESFKDPCDELRNSFRRQAVDCIIDFQDYFGRFIIRLIMPTGKRIFMACIAASEVPKKG